MGKIDEYNAIKSKNLNDITNLNKVMGLSNTGEKDSRNDKHYFCFYDKCCWDSDMQIFVHSSYGYYGDSSAYSISNDNIKKYILAVLNKKSTEIIIEAQELMQKDIESARLAAIKEAEEVLTACKVN